ncbi:hypothetical protein KFE25_008834 [Diacronema lutheri]|uniref:Uncharacterized protein n=1 Tax=Diacronema lutheri TaxID=2081491 RepID=A0A8J5XRK2_DIALT|nr:hypothetical protein KFE25_008834 [Diacronema lutheri]
MAADDPFAVEGVTDDDLYKLLDDHIENAPPPTPRREPKPVALNMFELFDAPGARPQHHAGHPRLYATVQPPPFQPLAQPSRPPLPLPQPPLQPPPPEQAAAAQQAVTRDIALETQLREQIARSDLLHSRLRVAENALSAASHRLADASREHRNEQAAERARAEAELARLRSDLAFGEEERAAAQRELAEARQAQQASARELEQLRLQLRREQLQQRAPPQPAGAPTAHAPRASSSGNATPAAGSGGHSPALAAVLQVARRPSGRSPDTLDAPSAPPSAPRAARLPVPADAHAADALQPPMPPSPATARAPPLFQCNPPRGGLDPTSGARKRRLSGVGGITVAQPAFNERRLSAIGGTAGVAAQQGAALLTPCRIRPGLLTSPALGALPLAHPLLAANVAGGDGGGAIGATRSLQPAMASVEAGAGAAPTRECAAGRAAQLICNAGTLAGDRLVAGDHTAGGAADYGVAGPDGAQRDANGASPEAAHACDGNGARSPRAGSPARAEYVCAPPDRAPSPRSAHAGAPRVGTTAELCAPHARAEAEAGAEVHSAAEAKGRADAGVDMDAAEAEAEAEDARFAAAADCIRVSELRAVRCALLAPSGAASAAALLRAVSRAPDAAEAVPAALCASVNAAGWPHAGLLRPSTFDALADGGRGGARGGGSGVRSATARAREDAVWLAVQRAAAALSASPRAERDSASGGVSMDAPGWRAVREVLLVVEPLLEPPSRGEAASWQRVSTATPLAAVRERASARDMHEAAGDERVHVRLVTAALGAICALIDLLPLPRRHAGETKVVGACGREQHAADGAATRLRALTCAGAFGAARANGGDCMAAMLGGPSDGARAKPASRSAARDGAARAGPSDDPAADRARRADSAAARCGSCDGDRPVDSQAQRACDAGERCCCLPARLTLVLAAAVTKAAAREETRAGGARSTDAATPPQRAAACTSAPAAGAQLGTPRRLDCVGRRDHAEWLARRAPIGLLVGALARIVRVCALEACTACMEAIISLLALWARNGAIAVGVERAGGRGGARPTAQPHDDNYTNARACAVSPLVAMLTRDDGAQPRGGCAAQALLLCAELLCVPRLAAALLEPLDALDSADGWALGGCAEGCAADDDAADADGGDGDGGDAPESESARDGRALLPTLAAVCELARAPNGWAETSGAPRRAADAAACALHAGALRVLSRALALGTPAQRTALRALAAAPLATLLVAAERDGVAGDQVEGTAGTAEPRLRCVQQAARLLAQLAHGEGAVDEARDSALCAAAHALRVAAQGAREHSTGLRAELATDCEVLLSRLARCAQTIR